MKLPQARFITSATKLENCPPSTGRPEYAVVGRSNVGKSSLLNTLAHQKALAKTSRTPGRTQLINFFDFGPFVFVDLPGYGYAKVSHAKRDYWSKELARFLRDRPTLQGVVHLMDARHPLQENDLQMREFLLQVEVPLLVVLTKVDDVKQSDLAKAVRLVRETTDQDPILFSSKTGRGRKELLSILVKGAPESEEEEDGFEDEAPMGIEEIEEPAGDA
jgi:GTP-binding protein